MGTIKLKGLVLKRISLFILFIAAMLVIAAFTTEGSGFLDLSNLMAIVLLCAAAIFTIIAITILFISRSKDKY